MPKLTKAQVRELSGPADDVSHSLDAERTWLSVDCLDCGGSAVIAAPEPGTNMVAKETDVEATLPDGSTVLVTGHVMAVESPTLLWHCDHCDTVQEATL